MALHLYSIIICTRNRADILEKCLQKHFDVEDASKSSREYIIVDNGSTDNTRDVVSRFAAMAKWPVNYVLEEKPGHSIALNRGCRMAVGSHLVFTDDDAIPAAGWLLAMDRCFREKNADWVFGPVFPIWGAKGKPAWFGPETGSIIACFSYGDEVFVSTDPRRSFAGVNHACRVEAITSLDFYDERLGLRGENSVGGNDDDLYQRALKRGYRIVYCPEMYVDHLIADTRLDKRVHLRNAWLVGRNQAKGVTSDSSTWFGTPRYIYRLLTASLFDWLKNCILCRHSAAFKNRLHVTRFTSMILTRSRDPSDQK
jgi:glucosyl-dolichyl phosphate glucuronosyltransferase